MYQNINPKIEKKIQEIINGNYEFSLLGTIGKENFPSISKILPMMNNNILYVLLSDLSCLLYTSPSPRDRTRSRMPSSA